MIGLDKVTNWCNPIQQTDFNEGEGDLDLRMEYIDLMTCSV